MTFMATFKYLNSTYTKKYTKTIYKPQKFPNQKVMKST